jgi:hypothetical protein
MIVKANILSFGIVFKIAGCVVLLGCITALFVKENKERKDKAPAHVDVEI